MFSYQEILDFWFEGLTSETPLSNKIPVVKKWFNGGADFDDLIRQRFGILLTDADKIISQSTHSPQERLAKIIVLDQFPRNIYRHTPQMYAFDPPALKLSLEGLDKSNDHQLKLVERIFFYMPLMHAEDLAYQERSVKLFESLFKLSKEHAPSSVTYFASNLHYAIEHCETVRNFGRFPSRNKILGRESTAEELDFLKK